jgi:hypothetical protein
MHLAVNKIIKWLMPTFDTGGVNSQEVCPWEKPAHLK